MHGDFNLIWQSHMFQEARLCSDKYWLQSSLMCLIVRKYTTKDQRMGIYVTENTKMPHLQSF